MSIHNLLLFSLDTSDRGAAMNFFSLRKGEASIFVNNDNRKSCSNIIIKMIRIHKTKIHH